MSRHAWRRPVAIGLTLALGMVLGVAGTAGARAETIKFTDVAVFVNHCVPEDVVGEATYHVTVSVVGDRNGGSHFLLTIKAVEFSGVGLQTGVPYHAKDESVEETYLRPPYPAEFTSERSITVVSQGGVVPNAVVHFVAHFTINAKGTPTATFQKPITKCTG